MKHRNQFIWAILCFIVILGLPGFASAMSNSDFSGRYIVGNAIFYERDDYITDVIQLDANGAGKVTYTTLYTTDTSGPAPQTLTYSVDASGKITIDQGSGNSLVGVLSPDGQYLTFTHSGSGVDPQIIFGIKESAGMGNTDLDGDYDLYGFLFEENELQTGASFLMSFDGKGNWEVDAEEYGKYSVTAKGHVSLESHYGMVANNGDVFFVATKDKNLDVVELIVGVRRSTGMSASDLIGSYLYAEIGTDAPKSADDYFYDFNAGKNNAYNFQGLANSSGASLFSGSGLYLIETDGTLTFTGDAWAVGSLSADGKVMAITGLDDDYAYFGIGISTNGGTTDGDDVDNDGDGFTENQGDCNDNNASIHPEALDPCADGIDQNCDGHDETCTDAPGAPTGVFASDNTVQGEVQVIWNSASGATAYDIYRADMPAWTGTSPTRIAANVSGLIYDDTSAQSGNRYYYWVKARNASGVSKYSMFDTGYWGTPGSIPAVPKDVYATDSTPTDQVTVSWTASAGTLVYEIYRADIPAYLGGNIGKITTVTAPATTYNDKSAAAGNRYYYWVKARNSWGISRYSKYDTGYVGAASSPLSPPANVNATEKILGSNVTITWDAVTGAVVYEIYRAASLPAAGGKPARIGFLDGLSFVDTTLTCGTPYYYWVKARDSWGSSKYSVYDIGGCGGFTIP